MSVNLIYLCPKKDQIEEWRKMTQELIEKAKVDDKKAKERHEHLINAIKNGAAVITSFICMMLLYHWGSRTISKSNLNDTNYLAKYAIDASLIIGLSLNTVLLLKFFFELFSHNQVETLKKMNSLLILFEQLNSSYS